MSQENSSNNNNTNNNNIRGTFRTDVPGLPGFTWFIDNGMPEGKVIVYDKNAAEKYLNENYRQDPYSGMLRKINKVQIDDDIPEGTIMYYNRRTKKWQACRKGMKLAGKRLAIRVEGGVVPALE